MREAIREDIIPADRRDEELQHFFDKIDASKQALATLIYTFKRCEIIGNDYPINTCPYGQKPST